MAHEPDTWATDHVSKSIDGDDDAPPGGATIRRSRWWAAGAVAAVVAFVASVVLSTGSRSVPVGASGAMPGMSVSLGYGRLALTVRDVDGREVRLPGGRPGVVVFAGTRGCASCVAAVRGAGGGSSRIPALGSVSSPRAFAAREAD